MRSLLLFSVGVFCGVVLGVCGVWVGCVVFFVVAEAAARQLERFVAGCWLCWWLGWRFFHFLLAGFRWRVCVWLVVVLGFLLAAHAGALIVVCLVLCVRVLCENSIVCQCTFVLVAAGATVLWWLL